MRTATAESVSNGHPDKVADILADSLVDAHLKEDPEAHCGIKTLVSKDLIVISGEIGSRANVNMEKVVRETLLELGFDGQRETFNGLACPILPQYNDVRHELDDPTLATFHEQGAADQCFVVGYACDETNLLLPAASVLARRLIDQLTLVREKLPYLRLDAKSLLMMEYKEGVPTLHTVVLSTEHESGFPIRKLRTDLEEQVISPILSGVITPQTRIFINPIGPFENAGPHAETGLSGRKIVADAYGSAAPVGGGAFSGKDPSKCDRSAAYYARHIAKNVVANGLATSCRVMLSYGIGLSRPLSVDIQAEGNTVPLFELEDLVRDRFHFTPRSIIQQLGLLNLSYKEIAKKGHFGHPDYTWEHVFPMSI